MTYPDPIPPLTGEEAEGFHYYLSHDSCGPDGCDKPITLASDETCADYRARLRRIYAPLIEQIRAQEEE